MGIVIEVEAGRAVDNNQFLKDLFQACMMDGISFLVIAVRNYYRVKANNSKGYKEDKDFDDVTALRGFKYLTAPPTSTTHDIYLPQTF